MIVIKSLSQSFGVPGLRLGYVYCANPEVIRVLDDEIPIRNLSGPAEFFLELMLKNRADFERSLAATKADRAAFATLLAKVPVVAKVHPSGGNFLLATLRGNDPTMAASIRTELLEQHGIDVRGRLEPPAAGHAAVASGGAAARRQRTVLPGARQRDDRRAVVVDSTRL